MEVNAQIWIDQRQSERRRPVAEKETQMTTSCQWRTEEREPIAPEVHEKAWKHAAEK